MDHVTHDTLPAVQRAIVQYSPRDEASTGTVRSNASAETYVPLLEAFAFFNGRLFAARAPDCLITLRHRNKAPGYFSPDRFATEDGRTVHEIALNPRYVLGNSVRSVLQTLAHEMCHAMQQAHGKPTRGGYHNAEWSAIMKAIGLYPSHTGQPGGKETGPRMSDYAIEGGPFALACDALTASGWTLKYGDVKREADKGAKPDSKLKYTCPSCAANVWGKPGLRVACYEADCMQLMRCVG